MGEGGLMDDFIFRLGQGLVIFNVFMLCVCFVGAIAFVKEIVKWYREDGKRGD